MKKFAIAIMAFATMAAQAANFVQVEQEHVKGRQGADNSDVTYVRGGKDFGDYSFGLQSRTSRFASDSKIGNSLEATVSNKNISAFGIKPFVGVAHNYTNGAASYNYGVVGATTGLQVGPGYAMAGVKKRVGVSSGEPKQTVGFVSYSVPVAKDVAVNVGASRSGETIKEKGFSVGLAVGF